VDGGAECAPASVAEERVAEELGMEIEAVAEGMAGGRLLMNCAWGGGVFLGTFWELQSGILLLAKNETRWKGQTQAVLRRAAVLSLRCAAMVLHDCRVYAGLGSGFDITTVGCSR
jgi:hypothetical protein